jgi:hypothetical protein
MRASPMCCPVDDHNSSTRPGKADGEPGGLGRLRSVANVTRIVVDGANVVGSRPNGWWRDRAGAAAGLAAAIQALVDADPATEVVLVLEGAARSGHQAGTSGRLRVVHAPASGDDEIVRQAADSDLVVTSDRELRRRVAPLRAEGPGWLLRQLDDHDA